RDPRSEDGQRHFHRRRPVAARSLRPLRIARHRGPPSPEDGVRTPLSFGSGMGGEAREKGGVTGSPRPTLDRVPVVASRPKTSGGKNENALDRSDRGSPARRRVALPRPSRGKGREAEGKGGGPGSSNGRRSRNREADGSRGNLALHRKTARVADGSGACDRGDRD